MASAPPTTTPATSPPLTNPQALDVLSGLYQDPATGQHTGLLVRLTSLPAGGPRGPGWRLELSEDQGSTWTSLEAGKPGYATPALAIETGAALISAWKASRTQGEQAEISLFFLQGKLERRTIRVSDPTDPTKQIEISGYAARAEDGTWLEDSEPLKAIEKAKAKRAVGAAGSNPTQGSPK